MSPPPGGDHDRGPDMYGTIIPISILSTSFVLARVYARIKLIQNVGWDDYTIVLAQVIRILVVKAPSIDRNAVSERTQLRHSDTRSPKWARPPHVLFTLAEHC